jgi:nicotinamide riboside kinase
MRKDMVGNWSYLSKPARQELAMRVVVCGGESTGTTTLAKDLAEHYGTPVVPEYGRHFDWGVGKAYKWCSEDFHEIAHEQNDWIDRMALRSQKGVIIADTDAFATAMFHEIYLGHQDWDLLEYAMRVKSRTPFYIVTSHEGVEFEDDGTRFNSGKREWATKWFQEFVPNIDGKYQMTVVGDRETRKKLAIEAIDARIKDHFVLADPIGEVVNG